MNGESIEHEDECDRPASSDGGEGAAAAALSALSAAMLVVGIGLAFRWSPSEVKLGVPFIAWFAALGAGCYYVGRALGRAKRERRRLGGILGLIAAFVSLAAGLVLAYLLLVIGEMRLF
ncbi:MAG: hypothetical protein ACE5O2_05210 [Armatimonadota bacterium]